MATKHFLISALGAVTFFNTAGQAKSAAGEGDFIASKQDDLLTLPGPVAVKVYNAAATAGEGKPVTKFSDREAAARRVWPTLDYLAVVGKVPEGAARVKSTNGTGQRGRASAFTGKVIRKLVEGNPRRENSWGWKSYNVIRDGMKFETFIANGGRLKDLAWDVKHKNVKVVSE